MPLSLQICFVLGSLAMLLIVFAIATEPVLRYLTILVGKLRFYYLRLRGRSAGEDT